MITFGSHSLRDEQCVKSVAAALRAGFTRIDTAASYKNEQLVADGITLSGVPRRSIHITSKIGPKDVGGGPQHVRAVIQNTLKIFGGYCDCILMHWPGVAGVPQDAKEKQVEIRQAAWKVLSEFRQAVAPEKQDNDDDKRPLVREIGASNFLPRHLLSLEFAGAAPVEVVQMELHPLCLQRDVMLWVEQHKETVKRVEAYGLRQCATEIEQKMVASNSSSNNSKQNQEHERSTTTASSSSSSSESKATSAASACVAQNQREHVGNDVAIMDQVLQWCAQNNIVPIVRASSEDHLKANLAALKAPLRRSLRLLEDVAEQTTRSGDKHNYWFSENIA